MGALELDDEVLCGFCHNEAFFFFFLHYHSFNTASCIICVFHRPYNRHRHYKTVRFYG